MKRAAILAFASCQILLAAAALHAGWEFSNSGTVQDLNSLFFVDTSTGWAVGAAGTIVKTQNTGVAWSAQTSGVGTTLQDIQFASLSTGVIVGSGGLILRTTDGFRWNTMTSGTANNLFAAGWANSTGTVWAVGGAGTIRVSTNTGALWGNGDPSGNSPSQNLRGVFFVNESTGWAVGDAGTLIRTGNGGNTWSQINSGTAQNLRDVFFVNSSTGFIVGDNGVIFKSTNTGVSWRSQISTATSWNGIHFLNVDRGWAVGSGGLVVASTDGGRNFVGQQSTTTNALNDVQFLNVDLGFAVGNGGMVIKFMSVAAAADGSAGPASTDTVRQQGAITPINNLFDPSRGEVTSFQYFFKFGGRVSIKIYTMQGRLVRTLLNDFLPTPGTYSDVAWDGKNENGELVAAGIYLVHMEAPNFSESKKIAVIR